MLLQLKQNKKSGQDPKGQQPKEKDAFVNEQKEGAGNPPAPVGLGRRLLVVDDNAVVLKAFENKLKADGFEVTTLGNAAHVASAAEESKAELILLDINFPSSGSMDWTGFTVMQWIRRFPELAKIPVILITGSDQNQYQDKAIKAGAVALFEKPIDYPKLLTTVLEALPPKITPSTTSPA